MSYDKIVSKPTFQFNLNSKLEVKIRQYIESKERQEISGGLIGEIKGGKSNQIIFDVKKFLPFPNLADKKRYYAEPPKIWYDILEEWRLFYFSELNYIGFLLLLKNHFKGISEYNDLFVPAIIILLLHLFIVSLVFLIP